MTGAPHRIGLALDQGALSLPDGPVAVLNAHTAWDYAPLQAGALTLQTDLYPDHAMLSQRGFDVARDLSGSYASVLVQITRSKPANHLSVARAWQHLLPGGVLLIDGQKTDGIDSLLKEVRRRAPLLGSLSKAHGKLFWLAQEGDDPFGDWADAVAQSPDGFVTTPGIFSADKVDTGSALLAAALPQLSGVVADLGAGWGYLSRAILTSATVSALHVIEADARAVDCALQNVPDPRAMFHWADATALSLPRCDAIVMNPPFHTGRAATPALGQGFIRSAADLLAPRGQLWMVANQHLPYEATLAERFADVQNIRQANGFKVLHARHPRRR